jgi:hypothetical protein
LPQAAGGCWDYEAYQKFVVAVGAVMVAMLAPNSGSAMADDDRAIWGWGDDRIESVEIESGGKLDIEFEGGGDIETYDLLG